MCRQCPGKNRWKICTILKSHEIHKNIVEVVWFCSLFTCSFRSRVWSGTAEEHDVVFSMWIWRFSVSRCFSALHRDKEWLFEQLMHFQKILNATIPWSKSLRSDSSVVLILDGTLPEAVLWKCSATGNHGGYSNSAPSPHHLAAYFPPAAPPTVKWLQMEVMNDSGGFNKSDRIRRLRSSVS